jgi:selenocysteine lyase/cysteine desulfurase
MERRDFVAVGLSGALAGGVDWSPFGKPGPVQDQVRARFPRLRAETFVNAAAGTPLGVFAESGIQRYAAYQRLGPGDGRADYINQVMSDVRASFGNLIGARTSEIALVHCTKAGEQIVLDGLDPGRRGRNVVTNDMHFTGSLHNLIGLRRSGVDVRIVRGRDWNVSLDDMSRAIDDETALVAVTLVSNITGRIEPMRELADIAHARGALVYADIIQAAGILPVDVRALGIDFAAANGYKWLYGVHGAGFLFVRDDLQGSALPDRVFPGNVAYNYPPWVSEPDPDGDPLVYEPRTDARRYEPGHASYLGYCAVYEGMEFLRRVTPDLAHQHTVSLNQRLIEQVDETRYELLPRDVRSPIVTYRRRDGRALAERLAAARVTVSLLGSGRDLVRISPAIYNTAADVDRVTEVLNGL